MSARRLVVSIPARGSAALAEQRAVLATLPVSFALASGTRADIVVLDPLARWWETLAELPAASPAAVVLPDPGPAPSGMVSELGARSDSAGAPVVVMRRHAGLAASRSGGTTDGPEPGASVSAFAIVHRGDTAVETAARLGSALLDQLALLRSLALPPALDRFHADPSGYLTAAAGAPTLSAVVSRGAAAPRLELTAVSCDARWSVRFDDAAHAAPVRITRESTEGRSVHTLGWESGYRKCWQALHARLTAGETPGDDLAGFAVDLTLAAAVLRRLSPSNAHLDQIGAR